MATGWPFAYTMWPLTTLPPSAGCDVVGGDDGDGDTSGPVTRKLRRPALSTATLAAVAGGFVITSQVCPDLAHSASYVPVGRVTE